MIKKYLYLLWMNQIREIEFNSNQNVKLTGLKGKWIVEFF